MAQVFAVAISANKGDATVGRLIDADYGTTWSAGSDQVAGDWVRVDFGSPVALTRIKHFKPATAEHLKDWAIYANDTGVLDLTAEPLAYDSWAAFGTTQWETPIVGGAAFRYWWIVVRTTFNRRWESYELEFWADDDSGLERRIAQEFVYIPQIGDTRQIAQEFAYVVHGPNERRIAQEFVYVVTPSNTPPDAPTVAVSAVTNHNAFITGSAYSDPAEGDPHFRSQFRVRRADTLAVVYTSAELGAVESHQIPANSLPYGTELVASAQYGDEFGWSGYGADSAPFETLPGLPIVATAVGPDAISIDLTAIDDTETSTHKLYRSATDPTVAITPANHLVDLGDALDDGYLHTGLPEGQLVYYRMTAVHIATGTYLEGQVVASATTETSIDEDDDPGEEHWLELTGLTVGTRYAFILVGYDALDAPIFESAIVEAVFGLYIACADYAGEAYVKDSGTGTKIGEAPGEDYWYWQNERLLSALQPVCSVIGRPPGSGLYGYTSFYSPSHGLQFLGAGGTGSRDGYVAARITLDPNITGRALFYPQAGMELIRAGVAGSVEKIGEELFGIFAEIETAHFTPGQPPGPQSLYLTINVPGGGGPGFVSVALPEPALVPWWNYAGGAPYTYHGKPAVLELEYAQDLVTDPTGGTYDVSVRLNGAELIAGKYDLGEPLSCGPKGPCADTRGGGVQFSSLQCTGGPEDAELEIFEDENGNVAWNLPPGTEVRVYRWTADGWVYWFTTTAGFLDLPWSQVDDYGGEGGIYSLVIGEGGRLLREAPEMDDGAMTPPLVRTAEVAPAGLGGELEWSQVYLTSRNRAIAGYDLTPIVDGELLTTQSIVLPASADGRPLVRVSEIPLYEVGADRSALPRGPFLALLITTARIRLETESDCGVAAVELGTPFPELLGAEAEFEKLQESFPDIPFAEELLIEAGPLGFFAPYAGTDGRLLRLEQGPDDDGTDQVAQFRSDDVLPAGEGGECLFTTLYLLFARSNEAALELEVDRIVDGVVLGDPVAITLEAVTAPITDVIEVPLEEDRDGASYHPRGQAIAYRLRTVGALPTGTVILVDSEVEYEVVRESMRAHDA